MKLPWLCSVLFATITMLSPLLGGSGSWQALVCSYGSSVVTPVLLPLEGSPIAGTAIHVSGAHEVAITPDATMAVVADDSSIYALDLTETTLREKFPLLTGSGNGYGVAITPDGSKAYVGMENGGLLVIRLSDFLSPKTISPSDLGGYPEYIAISPTKSEAYVILSGQQAGATASNPTNKQETSSKTYNDMIPAAPASLIRIIDTTTDTVTGSSIPLSELGGKIVVTPNGSELYITTNQGLVYVSLSDSIPHTIGDTSLAYSAVAVTPNGTTVCTVSTNDNRDLFFSRIDTASHTVLSTVQLSSELSNVYSLFITPDGKTACIVADTGGQGMVGSIPAALSGQTLVFMDATGSGTSPSILSLGTNGYGGISITPDQAPTARFTATSNGLSVTFDASTSDSPVGTVVLYDWDFGDGQTQSTTSPTITHTYSTGGTQNVTLTVTNTAGTSTEVTFTGQTVSNNGGPSAVHTEAISVVSPGPTHFQGRVVLHHKHNHKTRRADLKTTWRNSESTTVKQYEIFARNKRVSKISVFDKPHKTLHLHPHHFPSHVSKKYRLYLHDKYKIRAVDIDGTASPFTKLRVKH
jgi:DNA-binding beta-propeller fold protein YncE